MLLLVRLSLPMRDKWSVYEKEMSQFFNIRFS
jgi:hypothetical protein